MLGVIFGAMAVMPVSYTHLDVYKRQVEKRSIINEFSLAAFVVSASLILRPVSYTHLDVYKRQE